MAQSARAGEKCLGRSEIQVHVEAHRQVVLVVCDIEGDDFLLLSLFCFKEGEDQASVFRSRVLHFESFLPTVFNHLRFALFSVSHHEFDTMPFLESGSIERTCPQHHAEHVVGTDVSGVSAGGFGPAAYFATQCDVALSGAVGVGGLVVGVAFSLKGTFFVMVGHKVVADVGDERVAHHEEFVGTGRGARDELCFIGRLSVILCAADVHRGRTGFHPHELPIVIKVIHECLTAAESCVLGSALCLHPACVDAGEEQEKGDEWQKLFHGVGVWVKGCEEMARCLRKTGVGKCENLQCL